MSAAELFEFSEELLRRPPDYHPRHYGPVNESGMYSRQERVAHAKVLLNHLKDQTEWGLVCPDNVSFLFWLSDAEARDAIQSVFGQDVFDRRGSTAQLHEHPHAYVGWLRYTPDTDPATCKACLAFKSSTRQVYDVLLRAFNFKSKSKYAIQDRVRHLNALWAGLDSPLPTLRLIAERYDEFKALGYVPDDLSVNEISLFVAVNFLYRAVDPANPEPEQNRLLGALLDPRAASQNLQTGTFTVYDPTEKWSPVRYAKLMDPLPPEDERSVKERRQAQLDKVFGHSRSRLERYRSDWMEMADKRLKKKKAQPRSYARSQTVKGPIVKRKRDDAAWLRMIRDAENARESD